MVSNYDDKGLRSTIIEGKRHFHIQKKTSLFGSETPREEKVQRQRRSNANNIFGAGEPDVLNRSSLINDSKKVEPAQEKRATLEELQRYNPWGKPGAGAPNESNINISNRARWEYEQEIKAQQNGNGQADPGFPGFNAGFGIGQKSSESRRRSDISNNLDQRQNNYVHFNNEVAQPMYESNDQEPVDSFQSGQDHNEITYKKYEETKAMADNLEKEIEQLKLKQLEERYAAMRDDKNMDYGCHDEHDYGDKSIYTDDALYREAENRARLRELERLRDAYDRDQEQDSTHFMSQNDVRDQPVIHYNSLGHDQFVKSNAKNSGTNNRNDYRQYTIEEYLMAIPEEGTRRNIEYD